MKSFSQVYQYDDTNVCSHLLHAKVFCYKLLCSKHDTHIVLFILLTINKLKQEKKKIILCGNVFVLGNHILMIKMKPDVCWGLKFMAAHAHSVYHILLF